MGSYCHHGLLCASRGGHLDIVQMIVEHHEPSEESAHLALRSACNGCAWDVIFYLKEKFKITQINGLQQACRGRHRKLVDWLIENGDNNWDDGLFGACESGDVSLIQLMIDRGATSTDRTFNVTCERGNVEACKYLLQRGYNIVPGCYVQDIESVEMKKLLIDYDEGHMMHILASDICTLLNAGVSLQKLLRYENPDQTTYVVGLANNLLQVIQLSLQGTVCTDLVNALKLFIGYDVNMQVMEAIE